MKKWIKMFLAVCVLCLPYFLCCAQTAQAKSAAGSAVAQAGENSVSGGKFQKTSKGIRYRNKNGTYLTDCWAEIDGRVYCFDADGYVITGAFSKDDKSYFADSKGRIYISKKRVTSNGTYYYSKSGAMLKNCWLSQNGKYYYFNAKGRMLKSAFVGKYYVGKNGARVTGKWVTSGGKKYYLDKNGVLAKNRWVGNYYVGPSGARVEGVNRKTLLAASTGKKTANTSTEQKLIIIGASRVVYMHEAVGSRKGVIYIAKKGQGYSWLKTTALPKLQAYLSIFPRSKVVIQLGNNDLNHFSQYQSTYRKLISAYPKTKFYFMDALPANRTAANINKNARRKAFNQKLAAAFPANYIGGYDYMEKNGFKTNSDGVHYTPATSRMIYRYILNKTGFKQ